MVKNNSDDAGGKSNLLSFDLPEVTEGGSGFIADEDFSWGESDPEPVTEAAKESEKKSKKFESDLSDAEQFRGKVSSGGESFDPAIHKVPPTETPKTGKWRKKSRRENDAQKASGDNPVNNAFIEKVALQHACMYAETHRLIYGESGKLENLQDVSGLKDSLTRYYMTYGANDLPPGADVILNAAFYSMGVAQRESNVEKTKRYLSNVGNFLRKLLGIRPKQPAQVHDIKTGKKVTPEERAEQFKQEQDNRFAGDNIPDDFYPESD